MIMNAGHLVSPRWSPIRFGAAECGPVPAKTRRNLLGSARRRVR